MESDVEFEFMLYPQSSARSVKDAAADLWRHTLSQIPTSFGRLTYLSSLRNPNTSRYEHYGLAQRFGEEEAESVLRQSHGEVFMEWLALSLDRQKADLDCYLASLPEDLQTTLISWAQLSPYRNLLPAVVREAERNLFISDLEILLELLRNEHGVVCPDPDA